MPRKVETTWMITNVDFVPGATLPDHCHSA